MLFIIGTLVGSFLSLAIHRIPKGENITHKRSYCPNCNRLLGFSDLIPVLSYISLKGKCKQCGLKISPRYLILELGSGIIFLLLAISLQLSMQTISVQDGVKLGLLIIYITTLLLIAGIDMKTFAISKGVLLFGLVLKVTYIIYLYVLGNNIYGYVIYLLAILVLLVIETVYVKKKQEQLYPVEILVLCMYMALWTMQSVLVLTIIGAIFIMTIKGIPLGKNAPKMSIGAYMCFANIVILIANNFVG